MAARVMKPTAPKKTPSKASGVVSVPKKPVRKSSAPVKKVITKKPKTVSLKVKKSRGEKEVRIAITNNTMIEKAPLKNVLPKKDKSEKQKPVVPSTSVLPKPAIASPFRFPMLSENRLPAVARLAGFAFVGIGAFFSLFNIATTSDTMLSFIGKSNTATVAETTTAGTVNNPTISNTPNTVDPAIITPTPNISIEGNVPLSGVVPVTIDVANASNVKVIATNRTTGQTFILGSAVMVDASTWRVYWATSQYSDAEYRITVVIVNQYTTYNFEDDETYSVNNQSSSNGTQAPAISDTTVSTTTIGSEATISTSTAPSQTTVSFYTSKSGTVEGNLQFKILVQEATRITVNARNAVTNVLYYVGQAKNVNGNEWVLDWDSKQIPDGTYNFFVSATIAGAQYESTKAKLVLKNGVAPVTEKVTEFVSTTTVASADTAPLQPSVSLSLKNQSNLSGFVDISVTTSAVTWVELYAVPKNALVTQFLGLAKRESDTAWKYAWDTTNIPNGPYTVYARVKSEHGFTESTHISVNVLNTVTTAFTVTEEDAIDTLHAAENALVTTVDKNSTTTPTADSVYIESVESFVTKLDANEDEIATIQNLLRSYRKTLEEQLSILARAERNGDADGVRVAKESIELLKMDIMDSLHTAIAQNVVIDQINAYVSHVTLELQKLSLRNETILKERMGDAINTDSDRDGVSDYDEVHLYKTNPYAADTDGDGFIDSAEIRLGYDPHDSTPETPVSYESPRETGTEREDLLSIDTLTTLTSSIPNEKPTAFISGTALPNSFVTLYIYSTPVMVTLKTNADGSWSYIFDKELENGEHEVYIAITDNTGSVVAKSKPVPFIKTAEAYTRSDSVSAALEAQNAEPSLLSNSGMLIVGSLMVVSLGLVLLLLGSHSRNRKVFVEATLTT